MIDLPGEARQFADEISELLNSTVTNGIRISYQASARRGVILGYRVSKTQFRGEPIPLCVRQRATPKLFLHLGHTLTTDDEGQYLTSAATTYSVQYGDTEDAPKLWSYDYVRAPGNKYPPAHLHIYGESKSFDEMFSELGLNGRKLRDLHLPVGGKRFRPSLEDIIEMLVLENLVEARDGWKDVIESHRAAWQKKQLAAAVRRDPETARAALRQLDNSQ